MAKRKATIAEKLFVVSGDGSTGNPGTMGAEGPLTAQNVSEARSLPS